MAAQRMLSSAGTTAGGTTRNVMRSVMVSPNRIQTNRFDCNTENTPYTRFKACAFPHVRERISQKRSTKA